MLSVRMGRECHGNHDAGNRHPISRMLHRSTANDWQVRLRLTRRFGAGTPRKSLGSRTVLCFQFLAKSFCSTQGGHAIYAVHLPLFVLSGTSSKHHGKATCNSNQHSNNWIGTVQMCKDLKSSKKIFLVLPSLQPSCTRMLLPPPPLMHAPLEKRKYRKLWKFRPKMK